MSNTSDGTSQQYASELARDLREYKKYIESDVAPDEGHLDTVVSAKDVAENVERILYGSGAAHPGIELVVEFRQRITVRPPDDITDPEHAKNWFWNVYPDIGTDAVDTRNKDHFEILAAKPGDER